MNGFFYLQRAPRPAGRHRAQPARHAHVRKAGHVLSFFSSLPWQATGRHLTGLAASIVLLLIGTGLAVWAALS